MLGQMPEQLKILFLPLIMYTHYTACKLPVWPQALYESGIVQDVIKAWEQEQRLHNTECRIEKKNAANHHAELLWPTLVQAK